MTLTKFKTVLDELTLVFLQTVAIQFVRFLLSYLLPVPDIYTYPLMNFYLIYVIIKGLHFAKGQPRPIDRNVPIIQEEQCWRRMIIRFMLVAILARASFPIDDLLNIDPLSARIAIRLGLWYRSFIGAYRPTTLDNFLVDHMLEISQVLRNFSKILNQVCVMRSLETGIGAGGGFLNAGLVRVRARFQQG